MPAPPPEMPESLWVLESINDGVYVTNRDRRIVYWNRAAERITGWPAKQILGRCCHDGILCHEDKDGHRLCGQEHCPLHRAIVSGEPSVASIIVFARRPDGSRVPLKVTVAPVYSAAGAIVGGVETFRDLSGEIHDVEKARRIQASILKSTLPPDDRLACRLYGIAQDIIGGDYCAVSPLDENRYGFMLADVCGHGVPAALYTMLLRSFWDSERPHLAQPGEFAAAVSRKLCEVIGEEHSFAAAVCGVADLKENVVRLAGAGGPEPLLYSRGKCTSLPCKGLPLGLFETAQYEEVAAEFQPGDCLLLFSDGATEISLADGSQLGPEGLADLLDRLGYPGKEVAFERLETALLKASNRIRFDDDMSFLEIRRR